MNTSQRLETYQTFDADVVEAVTDAAARQNSHTFNDLAAWYGVDGGPAVREDVYTGRPVEYLHFKPNGDYDETYARVLHNPMATPIDASTAMRAIRLFGADPTEQLIVVGNPGALGRGAGKLSFAEARRVWNGDLAPAAVPTVRLLGVLGVCNVGHLGYSYGADKAASAVTVGPSYGVTTRRAVLAESVATLPRGLARLAKDFQCSGALLEQYVAAPDSRPLERARKLADTGLPRYVAGLLRVSNLAIAKALSMDLFRERVTVALDAEPSAAVTVAWGGQSEMADDETMRSAVTGLRAGRNLARLTGIRVPGMHHAGGDDIDLHAALMLQGLRGGPDRGL